MYCILNDDGTATVTGTVTFQRFTDYSSIGAYCSPSKTSRTFKISNVTSIPSKFEIDSNTTLHFSNGRFRVEYSLKDDYSAHFYNKYTSSVTYGTLKERY